MTDKTDPRLRIGTILPHPTRATSLTIKGDGPAGEWKATVEATEPDPNKIDLLTGLYGPRPLVP